MSTDAAQVSLCLAWLSWLGFIEASLPERNGSETRVTIGWKTGRAWNDASLQHWFGNCWIWHVFDFPRKASEGNESKNNSNCHLGGLARITSIGNAEWGWIPTKWDGSQPTDGTMKQIWPPRLWVEAWETCIFLHRKELELKPPTEVSCFLVYSANIFQSRQFECRCVFLLKAWSRPKQLTSKVSSDQFLHVQALKVLRYLGMTSGATGPWIHVPISSMRRNYSELCMAWERFQQWCQVTRSARFHGNNQGENNASPTNQQILQQCSVNIQFSHLHS